MCYEWSRHYDENKRPYYYHAVTKETQWQKPPLFPGDVLVMHEGRLVRVPQSEAEALLAIYTTPATTSKTRSHSTNPPVSQPSSKVGGIFLCSLLVDFFSFVKLVLHHSFFFFELCTTHATTDGEYRSNRLGAAAVVPISKSGSGHGAACSRSSQRTCAAAPSVITPTVSIEWRHARYGRLCDGYQQRADGCAAAAAPTTSATAAAGRCRAITVIPDRASSGANASRPPAPARCPGYCPPQTCPATTQCFAGRRVRCTQTASHVGCC